MRQAIQQLWNWKNTLPLDANTKLRLIDSSYSMGEIVALINDNADTIASHITITSVVSPVYWKRTGTVLSPMNAGDTLTIAGLTVSNLTATYVPVAGVAGLLGNSIAIATATGLGVGITPTTRLHIYQAAANCVITIGCTNTATSPFINFQWHATTPASVGSFGYDSTVANNVLVMTRAETVAGDTTFTMNSVGQIGLGMIASSRLHLKSSVATSAGGLLLQCLGSTNNVAALYEIAADEGALLLATGGATKSVFRANGDSYINGGNFVIGNTSAISLLELYSSTAHPVLTITGAHATDYDPQMQFRTDASPTVKWSLGVDSLYGPINDMFVLSPATTVGGATAASSFYMLTGGSIGIGGYPSAPYKFWVEQLNTSASGVCGYFQAQINTSTNVTLQNTALNGVAYMSPSANKNSGTNTGLLFSSLARGAGNCATVQGVEIRYGRLDGAGTLDTAYGLNFSAYIGAGTTTTSYAIYHNAQASASITNKWFIYSAYNAPSVLTGSLGIGAVTVPASMLQIKSSGVGTSGGFAIQGTVNPVAYLYEIAANEGGLDLGSAGAVKIKMRANDDSYINTGHGLAIGATSLTAGYLLDITGSAILTKTTEQLRLCYDSTHYLKMAVTNTGAVNFETLGSDLYFCPNGVEKFRIVTAGGISTNSATNVWTLLAANVGTTTPDYLIRVNIDGKDFDIPARYVP